MVIRLNMLRASGYSMISMMTGLSVREVVEKYWNREWCVIDINIKRYFQAYLTLSAFCWHAKCGGCSLNNNTCKGKCTETICDIMDQNGNFKLKVIFDD